MIVLLKSHWGLLLVLLAYLAVAVFTSLRVPLHLGADEVAHFMFARFIRENGYLPLSSEDRQAAGYKSDQPPLNAALVALAYAWGDMGPPRVKLTADVPRRQLSVIADDYAGWQEALNTEDPWAGEILFWRVGRWLSVCFGAATLAIIYATALVVFAGQARPRRWALAAVMSVAFIPTFILVSSVLSYESLQAFWLALYLLAAVHLVRQPNRTWLYLLAGLCLGLAMVTKLSALIAPLGLVLLVLALGFRQRWSIWIGLGRLALGLAGIALGAGWWFGLILLRLNRVADLGWPAGLLHPLLVGDGSDPTASKAVRLLFRAGEGASPVGLPDPEGLQTWLSQMFRTFWRFRDQGQGPETGPIFTILLIVSVLTLFGLGRVWRRDRTARPWLALCWLQVALFAIFPVIRLVLVGVETGQGHHLLFPAAGAIAILLVWGLAGLAPGRWTRPYLAGMGLGLGLLGWSVLRAIQIYHPPLPVRTMPPLLPETAHSLSLDFGPVTLTGYELEGLAADRSCCLAAQPALRLTLYWQANELSQQDYLTEVKLVDDQGQTRSAWLGYPAQGRYPTRAWDPGDGVRDEIWLPVVGLARGVYTVTLRLLAAESLTPVEAAPGGSPLARLEVSRPLPPARAPVTVWQDGRPGPDLAEFTTWRTIQVTTRQAAELRLVGANQLTHAPLLAENNSHLFIVDPRWPKRETYRLELQAAGEPAWQTEPLLIAAGKGRSTQPPPSEVVVDANFAGQLKLLGYNLPERRVQPGQEIPVVLHLQAIKAMAADFSMFVRLRDRAGAVWGGRDRRPQEIYSTVLWAPEEVVEDGFTIKTAQDTPPGIYDLALGFYLPVGGAPVSLPLVQAGQLSDVTSVTLGPVKLGPTPSEFVQTAASPENPVNVLLGDQIALLGFDLAAGEFANLRMDESTNLQRGEAANGRMDEPPTPQPAIQPTNHSTIQPAIQPTNQPAIQPTTQPAIQSTTQPAIQPTTQPAIQPTNHPTIQPANQPTNQPAIQPTTQLNSTHSITLKLYWQPSRRPAADYTTFVHLRNAAGETVAQKDQPPLHGLYPTSLWEAGEIIEDAVTVPLPAALPPGAYHLVVGLYQPLTGARLAVPDEPANEIRLTTAHLGP